MVLKRGFTMIELLLATALAAVMMIGALRVVGSIRPQLPNDRQRADDDWATKLIELLRWDLANARIVWQEKNKLIFLGYDALDRRTFGWQQNNRESSVHQPVRVEYYLWSGQHHGQTWLLRKQVHTLEQTNRNSWSEVVASGVTQFELQQANTLLEAVAEFSGATWLDRPGPVPDLVRLVVQVADYDQDAINTTMIIR